MSSWWEARQHEADMVLQKELRFIHLDSQAIGSDFEILGVT